METLVRMQFGSHVYGTNVTTSDHDFKAVHLPPARDILLQRVQNAVNVKSKADGTQKNGPDDVDFESFSLQKYMALLLEGQTVAITMLFVPDRWLIESTSLWREIQANKHLWLHRGVAAFAGYCRQQANKYGIKGSRVAATRSMVTFLQGCIDASYPACKLSEHWDALVATLSGHEHVEFLTDTLRGRPECVVRMVSVCNRKAQEHVTLKAALKIYQHLLDEYGQRALMAETNEGVDWKALMHAVRVCREAEELLTHHTVSYPRPEAEMLLQIRKGELPYKQVAELIEDGMVRLEECQRVSTLPEKPNFAAAEELVAVWYGKQVAA
ncbi:DNA polymerase beta superfamily protein [Fimbriiglobus ruber]|nr:nucleotidyltransferase domain-containing protein [Fimbriiglobus ruber]